MKERPILFSAPMVRAILDGRKTQTRRIVKQKHLPFLENITGNFLDGKWDQRPFPYGKPGDRLWVRETFCYHDDLAMYLYKADDVTCCKWKPSIHMPRIASRILLEVVNVRVERLNDISEEDAIAEGINLPSPYVGIGMDGEVIESETISWMPSDYYKELWESINGPGSWDLNPWVWVVEFKILEVKNESNGNKIDK